MDVAKQLVTVLGMIGLATAVLLPGRQTPQVVRAVRDLLTGAFGTVISGKK